MPDHGLTPGHKRKLWKIIKNRFKNARRSNACVRTPRFFFWPRVRPGGTPSPVRAHALSLLWQLVYRRRQKVFRSKMTTAAAELISQGLHINIVSDEEDEDDIPEVRPRRTRTHAATQRPREAAHAERLSG